MCIVGEGEQRTQLEAMIDGDVRFEFKGAPSDLAVRGWLRQTRLFVSANVAEGFGITYVEAMAQGCKVAMPASGGGLEISPENVGRSVQLLPLSFDRGEVLATLRRALREPPPSIRTASFTVKKAVESYLEVDSRFSPRGRVSPSSR
jgi:glycosyltransferase involved in cell wall biosynthesis